MDQGRAGPVATLVPEKRRPHLRALPILLHKLLHQGAGDAGKARPEESFASAATNRHLERRVAGSNPEGTLCLRLRSHDYDCFYTMCPFCKPAGLLNDNCNVWYYNCMYCIPSENIMRKIVTFLFKDV